MELEQVVPKIQKRKGRSSIQTSRSDGEDLIADAFPERRPVDHFSISTPDGGRFRRGGGPQFDKVFVGILQRRREWHETTQYR
jgi:hypothetical protein